MGIVTHFYSLFVSAAFSLSLTSSSLCNFLVLDDGNTWRDAPYDVRAIGMWCFEETNGNRYEYKNDLAAYDSAIDSARSMGLVANIMGFCIWCICIIQSCIPLPAIAFYVTGLAALVTALFEGMKFMLFKSDYFCDGPTLGCSNYKGGRCSIAAIVLWFVIAFATCGLGKQQKEARQDRRDDREEDRRDDNKGRDDDKGGDDDKRRDDDKNAESEEDKE